MSLRLVLCLSLSFCHPDSGIFVENDKNLSSLFVSLFHLCFRMVSFKLFFVISVEVLVFDQVRKFKALSKV